METLSPIVLIAAAVIGIIIVIRILKKPIRFIFKMLINAGIGFLLLTVFNIFGSVIGLTLAVNAANILVTALLGVPGVILLILISFI